jgi:uroporphyrinogen-III synthase
MTRPLAVLRPEPGNTATVQRIIAEGLKAISLPLFAIRSLDWRPPSPDQFDTLLLTSANAIRYAGSDLAQLRSLPVIAVGAATGTAAQAAGFIVQHVGRGGAAAALARAPSSSRVLHLAGRDHVATGCTTIVVYASDPIDVDPEPLSGSVALVHSARAGARLADVVGDRRSVAVAAISLAAARAAGPGWSGLAIAGEPTDDALIAAARTLAD